MLGMKLFPNLYKIHVLPGIALQPKRLQQFFISALQQLVEDMEIPLPAVLVDNSGFLNQVAEDVSPYCTSLGKSSQVIPSTLRRSKEYELSRSIVISSSPPSLTQAELYH